MRATPFEGSIFNRFVIFVVDTDSYSGNFERPMTAFVTGCVGDCGVGKEYVEMFNEAAPEYVRNKLKDIVVSVPDDHGCFRPASIYPTPGYWNDGLGGHWKDEEWETEKVINDYRKRVEQERKKKLKDAERWGWKDYKPLDHLGYGDDIIPSRYTAYQSVAMFLDEIPDDDVLSFMVERAYKFSDAQIHEWDRNINIIGIRLVEEKVVATDLKKLV